MTYLQWFIAIVGALAVLVTVLPLWKGTQWWVRIWDFPRFQVALALVAVLAGMLIFAWPLDGGRLVLLAAVALSLAWQLSWIWRYLPLAPKEVAQARSTPDAADQITLFTTNVLQTSRAFDELVAIIRGASPDVILAVETDEWWCARLTEQLSDSYPHRLSYPLSNGYGMMLCSRLPLIDPSVRFIVDDAIPSIKTRVQMRTGMQIDLYGMHPQPPAPRQDTDQRDTELVLIGAEIRNSARPAVVLGDLNDVAWSPSTTRFKQTGALVDPRRGRGFFNTYPARWPGFRYPLDYVFHTPHFAICKMTVLPSFGSDHLPLSVTLRVRSEL